MTPTTLLRQTHCSRRRKREARPTTKPPRNKTPMPSNCRRDHCVRLFRQFQWNVPITTHRVANAHPQGSSMAKQSAFLLLLNAAIAPAYAQSEADSHRYDRRTDRHGFTVFLKNGGWCWFQDPRAIIHNRKLFVGGVQGNHSGAARLAVYDLVAAEPLGTVTLHDNFKRDDHNAPVFYARPDGSVLAVYALHGNNTVHYRRRSEPGNPLEWSDEETIRHDYLKGDRVTYMNLYWLKKEEKLYNFFRGIEFNPCFITSSDHGLTWDEPTHFIKSELPGRHRPYARYAASGTDTIHVSFTDGHPDRFGNNIYYAAFRDGAFLRANGQIIKRLRPDGPLQPSEAELVFQGSEVWAPEGRASAARSGWTSSIAIDRQGHPHIAYSVHLSNEDHRYRVASWDGNQWFDREVAHGGKCLYATQTSYTGLITLDPLAPSTVVISTNVDPGTGEDRGGKHEIFRAQIGLHDTAASIHWQAITKHSPVSNLRPVIVRDAHRRVILWNRGVYHSYTNYELDTVGWIENAPDQRSGAEP